MNPMLRLIGEGAAEAAPFYGLSGYGQYAHNVYDALQLDPPEGCQMLRKVAQLDNRPDALGETVADFQEKIKAYAERLAVYYALPSWLRWLRSKPKYSGWLRLDANAVWAKESISIGACVIRERESGRRSVWAVGNEPNALLASLDPDAYAELFSYIYRQIKGHDPEAIVILPELFMVDLIPPDVRHKAADILYQKAVAAGQGAITDALKWYGLGDLAGLLKGFTKPVVENTVKEVSKMLQARLFRFGTADYLQRVLNALPADCVPDGVGLHAYPFWDPIGGTLLSSLMAVLNDVAEDCQDRVYARWGKMVPIHVTEFGNPNPELGEPQALEVIRACVTTFEQRPDLYAERYLFKFEQRDAQLPDELAPYSRCVDDPAYTWDGNPTLNSIGEFYLLEAAGVTPRQRPSG